MTSLVGPEITILIKLLTRLPGFGPRSARRAALSLVKRREEVLNPLIEALQKVSKTASICSICNNIDTQDPCTVCRNEQRDSSVLIVVEDVLDLWALERSCALRALYHVLGGVLSPLNGVRPENLSFSKLFERLSQRNENHPQIKELILALNPTVDGQTTAYYILEHIKQMSLPIRVTRLAYGVPMGGELDYLDEGTLTAALKQRTELA
jgi:recombination protein RecR